MTEFWTEKVTVVTDYEFENGPEHPPTRTTEVTTREIISKETYESEGETK